MAPSVSDLNDDNKEDCLPGGDVLKKREEDIELNAHDDDNRVTIGLCRRLALSAGLMASDGGLVFLQLAMMPCLQTLGVPVSLVTVAGVISGSLAIMGLPMLGWISDGGNNPHRRKKTAVVVSSFVFVTGYSLVISGCILHLQAAGERPTSGVITNNSVLATMKPYLNSSVSGYLHQRQSTEFSVEVHTIDMLAGSEKNSSETESTEWMGDPLGLGIPLTGLLGILGFVFMDLGNDVNNSCMKSFVLTCTPRKQHDSMFVVGVLMSAVGGCVAAVLGVFDAAALFVKGAELDAVPAKTLIQSAFFLVFTVVCMLVTVLSAPPFQPNKPVGRVSSPSNVILSSRQPGYGSLRGDSGKFITVHDPTGSSIRIIKEGIICSDDLETACDSSTDEGRTLSQSYVSVRGTVRPTENKTSSLSVVEDPETTTSLLTGKKKVAQTSFDRCSAKTGSSDDVRCSIPEAMDLDMLNADDKTGSASSRSLECSAVDDDDCSDDHKDTDISGKQSFLDQHDDWNVDQGTSDYYRLQSFGRFSIRKTTLKMILVYASMFFMAGAWQSFNICATDYLGKVVYGGDPEADRRSQSYIAYEQGMTTGSRGVLMLNIAYVVVTLLQKKILALIGPKTVYLVVCVVQVAVLISLLLTNSVMVFYAAAIVYGLFRSVMYTVPFMLANTICQQASSRTVKGSANVGSTMALMTAMMPLSYVLVSTLIGPLIHATGDPASPHFYAIATTTLAATVFVFT